jgi:hypothetical protein
MADRLLNNLKNMYVMRAAGRKFGGIFKKSDVITILLLLLLFISHHRRVIVVPKRFTKP